MSNNRLFLSVLVISAGFIVPAMLSVATVKAEEIYTSPQMFVVPPIQDVHIMPDVHVSETVYKVINNTIILPPKKPDYSPVKTVKRVANVDAGKDIGVSKVMGRGKAVAMPDVNALALLNTPASPRVPIHVQENDQRYVDTTIAFLPAGVDLTVAQQGKFQNIINTYFIERDAQSIEVKVYATASSEVWRQGAKRKALARGLNIRNWLLSSGVRSDQIVLKAMGETNDESLPNRADIRILY